MNNILSLDEHIAICETHYEIPDEMYNRIDAYAMKYNDDSMNVVVEFHDEEDNVIGSYEFDSEEHAQVWLEEEFEDVEETDVEGL